MDNLKWRELLAVADMHCALARSEMAAKEKMPGADWRSRANRVARAIECMDRAAANDRAAHVSLCEGRGVASKFEAAKGEK